MIGIGTGAIALAGGAGNWVARDPVARNAHLYLSPETGRFAKSGEPAPFSQMGAFTAAGTRYQRNRNGALLSPVGVDVPRLADYSTGDRRWLMTGGYANECTWSEDMTAADWAETNGTEAFAGEILSPLGLPCTKVAVSGSSGQLLRNNIPLSGATAGRTYTWSMLVHVEDPNPIQLAVYESGGVASTVITVDTVFALLPGWNLISVTGTVAENDRTQLLLRVVGRGVPFDCHMAASNCTQTPVVMPPIVTENSPVTSAPEYFKSDLTGFDLSGGFGAFFHGTLHANHTLYDRILDFGDAGGNDRYLLRHQASQDELYLVHQTNGVSVGGVSTSYTLGTEFKAALLFGAGADATVFILNGDVIGTLSPASYDAPVEMRVASNHDQSDNHPLWLDTAALDVFAYDRYSIAELQARTAA